MNKRQTPPPWAVRVTNDAREKAGTLRALARVVGKSHSAISGWFGDDPSSPSATDIDAMLAFLGGDPLRAMPDYNTEGTAVAQVMGRVIATGTDVVEPDARELDATHLRWSSSAAYRYADKTASIVYLDVSGTSMEPQFPHNSLIACCRPLASRVEHIPNGWPLVVSDLRSPSEWTFKRIYRKRGRRDYVIACPLNPEHEPIVMPNGCKVEYMVLGSVVPFLPQTSVPSSAPNILNEENGK